VNKKDLSLFIYDENQDMLNRDSEVLPPLEGALEGEK
jgi:hypothetical protein